MKQSWSEFLPVGCLIAGLVAVIVVPIEWIPLTIGIAVVMSIMLAAIRKS